MYLLIVEQVLVLEVLCEGSDHLIRPWFAYHYLVGFFRVHPFSIPHSFHLPPLPAYTFLQVSRDHRRIKSRFYVMEARFLAFLRASLLPPRFYLAFLVSAHFGHDPDCLVMARPERHLRLILTVLTDDRDLASGWSGSTRAQMWPQSTPEALFFVRGGGC